MYQLSDFLKNFGKSINFEVIRFLGNDFKNAELAIYKRHGKIIGVKENEILIVGEAGYDNFSCKFLDWIPISIVTSFRSEM